MNQDKLQTIKVIASNLFSAVHNLQLKQSLLAHPITPLIEVSSNLTLSIDCLPKSIFLNLLFDDSSWHYLFLFENVFAKDIFV